MPGSVIPPLLFVVIAIVGVTGMLLWAGALVDASQYDDLAFDHIGRNKRPTFLVILFTWGFGGAWYWLRVRPQLRRAS
jgi:nitrogen fixation-related uncharacterized protein